MKFIMFLLSFLLALSSSCLADASLCFADDTNELSQLSHKAEFAMRCKNYAAAKEAYQALLMMGRKQLDTYTLADITIRIASIEKQEGQLKEASSRLSRLLLTSLPDDCVLRARLLQAHILQETSRQEEAFLILRSLLQKYPLANWPSDEQVFLISLQHILSERYAALAGQAKRLFDAALYSESAALYDELLDKVDSGRYPLDSEPQKKLEIIHATAKAHLYSGELAKVTALLQPLVIKWQGEEKKNEGIRKNVLLFARALKDQHRENEACNLLIFFAPKNEELEPAGEEILLELGLLHHDFGRLGKARDCLTQLLSSGKRAHLVTLARLNLAKVALKEHAYCEVESLLQVLASSSSKSDPLKYECAYLLGEAAFAMHNYEEAVASFEKAIPRINKQKAEWVASALYHLGCSYLKIAQSNYSQDLVIKAEVAFDEMGKCHLLGIKSGDFSWEERALLGKANVLLLRQSCGHEEELRKTILDIVCDEDNFPSLEGRAEALLIQAEATKDPDERMQLYAHLTESPMYTNTLAAKRAWAFRAIYLYRRAEELNSRSLFLQTAEMANHAYGILANADSKLAATALLLAARASDEKNALSYLELLLSSHCFASSSEQDEILYLHGKIAYSIFQKEPSELLMKKIESSLKTLGERFPRSPWADLGLFTLATCYFDCKLFEKSKDAFDSLYILYPSSIHAPQSLFFAAECLEQMENSSTEEIAAYRKNIFINYPNSALAAEAYFRLYSFTDYLHGGDEPLTHLAQMQTRYPKSPFLAIATYLLGVGAKADPQLSLEYLDRSCSLFELAYRDRRLPEEQFMDFLNIYYRAKIEYAALCLEQDVSFADGAIRRLRLVISDFGNPHHPFTAPLLTSSSYPRVCEECEYLMGRLLIRKDEKAEAFALYEGMIRKYTKAGITRSYYLAQVLYEMGKLEVAPQSALTYFTRAKEAGALDLFSSDQRLQLWMDESLCQRSLGHLDEAMLLLSYAINENVSSSLRIKAMLMRAEIYAEQGRHELAIKQLEAVARKGGEFALQAEEKLRSVYGFD